MWYTKKTTEDLYWLVSTLALIVASFNLVLPIDKS